MSLDAARPYGAEGEPDLGQLLFPEKRVPDLHDTVRPWVDEGRKALEARFAERPRA